MSISSINGVSWAPYTAAKNTTRQVLPESGSNATASSVLSAITTTSNPATASLTAATTEASTTAQQFTDYMQKTPAQQMQEAWLSQHGISADQFSAMSATEKQKLIDQMKAEIQAKVEQKVGGTTNILA